MKLHDYVDYYARVQPNVDLAVWDENHITYRDSLSSANRIAHALAAHGLKRGERFLLLTKNTIEAVLLYLGASKAGVVPVPLNYRLTPRDWSVVAEDVEAKIVVADEAFVMQVESVRNELKHVEDFIAIGTSQHAGWQNLDRWLVNQPTVRPDREIDERDDAVQMYTSGTTGQPKGAILSHRALMAGISQLATIANLSSAERFLLVIPLYHAAGVVAMLSCIASGGTLYLQRDFRPAEVVRVLSQERIGATMLVPAMIAACLREVPNIGDLSFTDLRMITYGASPIDSQTLCRAMQVFGCEFAQRYGTTETLSLSWLSPTDHRRALQDRPELLLSAGQPLPGTEIKVVDQQGRELPHGTIGQFVVRGPQLMREYWKSPDATADVLRDGWVLTGDAGFIDNEGYLYIRDRVKDIIVSGGENVCPHEIEVILQEHPDVAEAAVIGVPDEKWGETVKAVVVLRDGAASSEDQLIGFCRGKLAGFKLPHSVDFAEQLPRGPTGKVLKRELREPYWQRHDRRVS